MYIILQKIQTEIFNFEYNNEINIFRRKALNRKGLSGRANVTIVLETVATEIVILFYKSKVISPIKTLNEMNPTNPSTNRNSWKQPTEIQNILNSVFYRTIELLFLIFFIHK